MTDEPAVSVWHESMGLSTSAILRRTQDELAETKAALAASQADLTRVERERDEAIAAQQRLSDRLTESAVRIAAYRRDREAARREGGEH